MPDSLRPGQTRPAAGSRRTTPGTDQYPNDVQSLVRKIAELQLEQKQIIQRLSTQRSSVEEVGAALARLENEIAQAKERLSKMCQNPVGFTGRSV